MNPDSSSSNGICYGSSCSLPCFSTTEEVKSTESLCSAFRSSHKWPCCRHCYRNEARLSPPASQIAHSAPSPPPSEGFFYCSNMLENHDARSAILNRRPCYNESCHPPDFRAKPSLAPPGPTDLAGTRDFHTRAFYVPGPSWGSP